MTNPAIDRPNHPSRNLRVTARVNLASSGDNSICVRADWSERKDSQYQRD